MIDDQLPGDVPQTPLNGAAPQAASTLFAEASTLFAEGATLFAEGGTRFGEEPTPPFAEGATPFGEEPAPAPADDGYGTARVAQALAEIDGLEHQPLTEHAASYENVHAQLQAVLTEIDGA